MFAIVTVLFTQMQLVPICGLLINWITLLTSCDPIMLWSFHSKVIIGSRDVNGAKRLVNCGSKVLYIQSLGNLGLRLHASTFRCSAMSHSNTTFNSNTPYTLQV